MGPVLLLQTPWASLLPSLILLSLEFNLWGFCCPFVLLMAWVMQFQHTYVCVCVADTSRDACCLVLHIYIHKKEGEMFLLTVLKSSFPGPFMSLICSCCAWPQLSTVVKQIRLCEENAQACVVKICGEVCMSPHDACMQVREVQRCLSCFLDTNCWSI